MSASPPLRSFSLIAALERQRQEAVLLMEEEERRTARLLIMAQTFRDELQQLEARLPPRQIPAEAAETVSGPSDVLSVHPTMQVGADVAHVAAPSLVRACNQVVSTAVSVSNPESLSTGVPRQVRNRCLLPPTPPPYDTSFQAVPSTRGESPKLQLPIAPGTAKLKGDSVDRSVVTALSPGPGGASSLYDSSPCISSQTDVDDFEMQHQPQRQQDSVFSWDGPLSPHRDQPETSKPSPRHRDDVPPVPAWCGNPKIKFSSAEELVEWVLRDSTATTEDFAMRNAFTDAFSERYEWDVLGLSQLDAIPVPSHAVDSVAAPQDDDLDIDAYTRKVERACHLLAAEASLHIDIPSFQSARPSEL